MADYPEIIKEIEGDDSHVPEFIKRMKELEKAEERLKKGIQDPPQPAA